MRCTDDARSILFLALPKTFPESRARHSPRGYWGEDPSPRRFLVYLTSGGESLRSRRILVFRRTLLISVRVRLNGGSRFPPRLLPVVLKTVQTFPAGQARRNSGSRRPRRSLGTIKTFSLGRGRLGPQGSGVSPPCRRPRCRWRRGTLPPPPSPALRPTVPGSSLFSIMVSTSALCTCVCV